MIEFIVAQIDPRNLSDWDWPSIVAVALIAWGTILLQVGMIRSRRQVIMGSCIVLAAGVIAFLRAPHELNHYLFLAFAGLATAGGIGLLVFRDPVHAALGFATTILSTCGLFFLQSSPFIGAAMLIVYAGATIIVFLFVLMYAQQSDLTYYDVRLTAPILSVVLTSIFLAVLIHAVQVPGQTAFSGPEYRAMSNERTSENPGNTRGLGRSMFTDYLFAVEMAGALLTLSAVGAIAVSLQKPGSSPTVESAGRNE